MVRYIPKAKSASISAKPKSFLMESVGEPHSGMGLEICAPILIVALEFRIPSSWKPVSWLQQFLPVPLTPAWKLLNLTAPPVQVDTSWFKPLNSDVGRTALALSVPLSKMLDVSTGLPVHWPLLHIASFTHLSLGVQDCPSVAVASKTHAPLLHFPLVPHCWLAVPSLHMPPSLVLV